MEDINNEIINGNEKAFKKFFYTFYPGLCLFARSFMTSREIFEDIVQNVLIEYTGITARIL